MITVRVADAAYRDLLRLTTWLAPKSHRAADAAADTLAEAIQSLATLPERGRPVRGEIRELRVLHGRDGYVIRYRVNATGVTVTRVKHGRERR